MSILKCFMLPAMEILVTYVQNDSLCVGICCSYLRTIYHRLLRHQDHYHACNTYRHLHCGYSRLPHNPYPYVDSPGYGF
jgi:hypothetical protein